MHITVKLIHFSHTAAQSDGMETLAQLKPDSLAQTELNVRTGTAFPRERRKNTDTDGWRKVS